MTAKQSIYTKKNQTGTTDSGHSLDTNTYRQKLLECATFLYRTISTEDD